jgi:hypothetical protein
VDLDVPSKSRFPDLGVFDFMTLVISNHLKNTWKEGGKTETILEEIVPDALSTQIIDFYAEVWRIREDRNEHLHENNLYSPYSSQGTLNEQKASAKEILKSIFTKSSFLDLSGKVNTKHELLIEVSKLINKYIVNEVKSDLTKTDEINDFITSLFVGNEDFRFEVDMVIKSIWKGTKLDYIKRQGEQFLLKLMAVFINNIDNIMKITPNGLEMVLGVHLNYYFTSDSSGKEKLLTRNLLPASAKYIKNIKDDRSAELGDLTDEIFNEMLSRGSALFVGHDILGEFIVIEQDQQSGINNLPTNIIEGYYHRTNDQHYKKVFHNVFLTSSNSRNMLYGRILFKEGSNIRILNEMWFEEYFKILKVGDGHFSTSIQDSKLRQMQSNGESSKINIFSLRYFTVIGYSVGNQYTGSLQNTKTNIIPTLTYKPYLPFSKQIITSSRKKQTYNIPSRQELINRYGEDFVKEFNNIFTILADPYSKRNTIAPKIHKFLSILNGHTESGEYISGPGIDTLNSRVNELFTADGTFDSESFLKFIWKDEEGEFRFVQRNDQGFLEPFTQKMWLKNIFDAILSYEGSDKTIKRAKLTIEAFKARTSYANDFDIQNIWEYTTSEARLGEIIMEVVNSIFGHFSLRLMFMGMISYYNTINPL